MVIGGIFSSGLEAKRVNADTVIPTGFRFERTLRFGVTGEDVQNLQILLNRDSDTRVNAPGLIGGAGAETDYFGYATRNAIGKFQNKYAADVLRPTGLSRNTGIVGVFTRNKLNALLAIPLLTETPTQERTTHVVKEETPLVATTSPLPSSPALPASFDEINQKTRATLVNIVCTNTRSGTFNLISGSGVIVDPRGIILTNAHLGQYFLLQDFPTPKSIECVIRAGEPAQSKYRTTVLFISPAWVRDNASKIGEDMPMGTGENDFALLLIDAAVNAEIPLPETFPYLPMNASNQVLQEPREVLIAAYPVGLLGGFTVQRDLYPSSSIVTTGEVYSFGDNTPDIFSVGGSVVAQQGSSGGAVVSRDGTLVGLIVTSSSGKTTGERSLHALTMSHLDASFKKQTGDSLSVLLAGNVKVSAQNFNEKNAPELKKLLEGALTKD